MMKNLKKSMGYGVFEYILLISLAIIIALVLFVGVKGKTSNLPWLEAALGKVSDIVTGEDSNKEYGLEVAFYDLEKLDHGETEPVVNRMMNIEPMSEINGGDFEEGEIPEMSLNMLRKPGSKKNGMNIEQFYMFFEEERHGEIENPTLDRSGIYFMPNEIYLNFFYNLSDRNPSNSSVIDNITQVYLTLLTDVTDKEDNEKLFNKTLPDGMNGMFEMMIESEKATNNYKGNYEIVIEQSSYLPKKDICIKDPFQDVRIFDFLKVKAITAIGDGDGESGLSLKQYEVSFYVRSEDNPSKRSKTFKFILNLEDESSSCQILVGIKVVASDMSQNFPLIDMEIDDTGGNHSPEKMEELITIAKKYIKDNKIKVINKEDNSELTEGEYYVDYVWNGSPTDGIVYVDILRTSDDEYTFIEIPWNLPPEALCPVAKDSDFSGESNYFFKYTGSASCVTMPLKIKGVSVTSYYEMFKGKSIKKVISTNINIDDMRGMFEENPSDILDISELNTDSLVGASDMFKNSSMTKIIGLEDMVSPNLVACFGMFAGTELDVIDLTNLDTSKVTSMGSMFSGTKTNKLILGDSFNSENVETMPWMFLNSEIGEIEGFEKIRTNKVEDMRSMFEGSKITNLDLSAFNTTSATDMSRMFINSKATTIIFGSNFKTYYVSNMKDMFRNTLVDSLDISMFSFGSSVPPLYKPVDINGMFYDCQATEIYVESSGARNYIESKGANWACPAEIKIK